MHVRVVALRFCNIVLKHQGKYQRSPWFVVLRVKMRNESTKERLQNLKVPFTPTTGKVRGELEYTLGTKGTRDATLKGFDNIFSELPHFKS